MTLFERNMGFKTSRIYDIVIGATGAGPLDGGCVMFARALQMAYGGDIMVLATADDRADHAVLKLRNGHYMDADGVAEDEKTIIDRFNDYEMADATHIRHMRPEDLPEAPRDEEASRKVAEIIRKRPARMPV